MADSAREGQTVTRLTLIRHGEAEAAVRRIVGGPRGCTGLSVRGRRQCEALRDRLASTGEIHADVLLTSVLPRAIETAEIIGPALGMAEAEQDCDLCELHPGECDGMSWDEFDQRYRSGRPAWTSYEPLSPGGESWAEFHGRVGRALHRITVEHEGRSIVVACHGGVVTGSMVAFFGLPYLAALVELPVQNTSITEWELRSADQVPSRPPRWRLLRFNDAAHLAAGRDLDPPRDEGE